ncbi:MAG: choice-of-anchor D domain-containing protein, partial [Candidatus Marinimicrobia bacterium]|nr:choice-of-anchor D domain-containing protein [Candidatus Neomarinimicrobiota bacterium]
NHGQLGSTSGTDDNDPAWIEATWPYEIPLLSVSPDSIDFSYVLAGDIRTEQVTVKNAGIADLNVSSIAISGVDSVNFNVDTTSFTLTPGDSVLLDVNFTPDDTGSFSAALDIESDGGDASVVLTGIGFEMAGDYALEFDGVDDYMNAGNDSSLQLISWTLEAWIKVNELSRGWQFIIAKAMLSGDPNSDNYSLRLSEDNRIAVYFEDASGANLFLYSLQTIDVEKWYHVTYTFDEENDDERLYIDGELDTEQTNTLVPDPSDAASDNLYFGRDVVNNIHSFKGTTDEVRIWNYARTQEEIQANMSHHLDGDEEGLVGYWRMDEGSGQTVFDYSGNG